MVRNISTFEYEIVAKVLYAMSVTLQLLQVLLVKLVNSVGLVF